MPARAARTTASTPTPASAPAAPAVAEAPPPVMATATPAAETTPAAQPSGYRGLKVWQRAMDLAAAVRRVAGAIGDDVIRREAWDAAVAIPAHIAAGNSLYVRTEYVEHLSRAHGQVARLECLLHLADRIGAAPGTDTAALLASAASVGGMLRALARALQPKPESDASETVN